MALGNAAFFRAASRWAPRGSAREYTRGGYRIPPLPESGPGGLRLREFRRPSHAVPRTATEPRAPRHTPREMPQAEGRCPSGARDDVRSTTSYFHRPRHRCGRINPNHAHGLTPSIRQRTPQPLEGPAAEMPEPAPAQLHLRAINGESNPCRGYRTDPSNQAETVPIKNETEHDRLEQIVRQRHLTKSRKAGQKQNATRLQPQ